MNVYTFEVFSLSRAQLVPKSATIEDRFHPLPRSPLPFIYCSPSILYQAWFEPMPEPRLDDWLGTHRVTWLDPTRCGHLQGGGCKREGEGSQKHGHPMI